eukprot:TRINITY_DN9362_c0_g1_i1.p1 TRINITY_DN9362_c0_g1~~TRINITY_DN9362_c0_g1_i1.p1  ORF type:complete len:554 (-),score=152.47 TRINITY_DN9362_c0_g1_i1:1548-3209(-)
MYAQAAYGMVPSGVAPKIVVTRRQQPQQVAAPAVDAAAEQSAAHVDAAVFPSLSEAKSLHISKTEQKRIRAEANEAEPAVAASAQADAPAQAAESAPSAGTFRPAMAPKSLNLQDFWPQPASGAYQPEEQQQQQQQEQEQQPQSPAQPLSPPQQMMQSHSPHSPHGQQQQPSQTLWVGNVTENVNEEMLNNEFAAYGHVNAVKVLALKHCAFVTFSEVDEAVKAQKCMQGFAMDGHALIVHFRKQESGEGGSPQQHHVMVNAASKAVWIGNIDSSNVDPQVLQEQLQALVTPFGTVESVRPLPAKMCVFVNFATEQQAAACVAGLQGREFAGVPLRVNFGKTRTPSPGDGGLLPNHGYTRATSPFSSSSPPPVLLTNPNNAKPALLKQQPLQPQRFGNGAVKPLFQRKPPQVLQRGGRQQGVAQRRQQQGAGDPQQLAAAAAMNPCFYPPFYAMPDPAGPLCHSCFKSMSGVVLTPCMHMCCFDCARRIHINMELCPACHMPIIGFMPMTPEAVYHPFFTMLSSGMMGMYGAPDAGVYGGAPMAQPNTQTAPQ